MPKPTIFWSWQNLPSNSDEVSPLAIEKMPNGEEVALFYNHTRQQLFFECDGDYGVFVKGDE